jgi:hypothetical protein
VTQSLEAGHEINVKNGGIPSRGLISTLYPNSRARILMA